MVKPFNIRSVSENLGVEETSIGGIGVEFDCDYGADFGDFGVVFGDCNGQLRHVGAADFGGAFDQVGG